MEGSQLEGIQGEVKDQRTLEQRGEARVKTEDTEDTSSTLSPVDAQGSEFTLEDKWLHGSGATVAGAPPQGSTVAGSPPQGYALGGEAGEAAPQGSAGPHGPAVDAGAKAGGGEGPAEPVAGAPHGSTALNSIRDD